MFLHIKTFKIYFVIGFFASGLLSCAGPDIAAPVSNYNRSIPHNISAYIVKSSDTLYSIAWQSGHDYKELARWNGISRPYTIFIGQKLDLRPKKLNKKVKKQVIIKNKTLIKQKDTRSTSNLSKNRVQLTWQWPIKAKKLIKNRANLGAKIFGIRGELVRSSEKGKVVYAGSGLKGYGNLIIVKHNEEYLSAYGFNKRLLVKEGVLIKKGQAIAEIGLDGKSQHVLFFEIRKHGKPVDVTRYLSR
ncbi:MAG: hypothetical protein A6F71_01640 [Cycloclasticus sp. symbiont of Poecilosclerida sp. M]|nr:MAG: hypothetical protein A6F71_01640 [Cycloclasticus sp. symbiont of Poecilosclerida sp. M]